MLAFDSKIMVKQRLHLPDPEVLSPKDSFGFPVDSSISSPTPPGLDLSQRTIFATQEAFLLLYASSGSFNSASKTLHISIETPRVWIRVDLYGFRKRFEYAQHSFRESLEALAFHRVQFPDKNRGSDILLIFLLKGHWRDKYGDNAITTPEAAKQYLEDLHVFARTGSLPPASNHDPHSSE